MQVEAYLYSQHVGDSQLSLTDTLIDVSDLASRGILNHDSSVWISAHSPMPDLWMLTDRSSYCYIHRPRTPGYARIGKSDVRWASDWDSTISNPSLTLSRSDVAVSDESDVHITMIVKHRVSNSVLTVIKPDGRKASLVNGMYSTNNITVIDLAAFVPKELSPPDPYQRSHAQHMGAHHILRTVPKDKRGKVSRYVDLMRFDLSDQDMQTLQDVHRQMRELSAAMVGRLRDRFSEKGLPLSLINDEEFSDE